MSYVALYRKYRSQTFEDVMGQDHVTRTLQNAVKSGKIGHAYLFSGSRGTGKTTVARLLAKAVNCERGPTPAPCNECEACLSIADGSAVDFIELDAASHRGIQDVKDIRDSVRYPPMRLRYKVFVIDEAHQLTAEAKDAFLKTLEEPPPHAIFILATTEAHEIPLTIRSRCQQFDFRRGSVADISARLRYVLDKEGREADDAAVDILARAGQGSWRDGLSLLEQVLSYTEGRVTIEDVNTVLGTVDEDVLYQVSEAIAREDAAAAFELAGRIVHEGKDVREFLKAVAGHFRDLLFASVGPGAGDSLRAVERARQFPKDRLVSLVEVFSTAEKELRWNDQHRLALEMAFLKSMAVPASASVAQAPPVEMPRAAAAREAPVRKPARPVESPQEAQPPAPPEPAPAQPVTDGELTVAYVRSIWPRVISHIRDVQGKKLFLGILREAWVESVEDDVVCLGFDPKYEFHVQNVLQPANDEVIARGLEAVLGRKVRVKAAVVRAKEQEPEAPQPVEPDVEAPPPRDGERSDIVQQVLDTFPGSKLIQDVDIDSEDYNPWEGR